MTTGHLLDDVRVFDPDGREVQLGRLWAERTVVLVLVRHFGCLFCRQQLGDLLPWREEIRARGADLVVLGNGSVEDARAFRDEQRLPVPLLTDPSREAYCALEMRRGVGSVTKPIVFLRSLKALFGGFRQTRVAGDPLQQGGVVVVGPGGVERFRYVSQSAGDHPPIERILSALPARR